MRWKIGSFWRVWRCIWSLHLWFLTCLGQGLLWGADKRERPFVPKNIQRHKMCVLNSRGFRTHPHWKLIRGPQDKKPSPHGLRLPATLPVPIFFQGISVKKKHPQLIWSTKKTTTHSLSPWHPHHLQPSKPLPIPTPHGAVVHRPLPVGLLHSELCPSTLFGTAWHQRLL